MPNFKIEEPNISYMLEEILPESFEDDLIIKNQLLQEATYSHDTFQNLIFEKSRFKKINFSNNTYNRFECVDCEFESCDFSNMEWIGGAFHRTIFKNCKLTGTNFAEALLQNCQFIDCTITYASFNFTKLKRVVFFESQLTDSEFNDIDWQHLELNHCELNRTTWIGTKLNKLNVSSCQFESLNLSPDLIRGFVVNQEQAIIVGMTLGLILDEPR